MRRFWVFLGWFTLVVALTPLVAHGKPKPKKRTTKGVGYAVLSPNACLGELAKRGIPFSREKKAPGVRIPIRLTAKLGGVLFRTDFPDKKRPRVPWEIYDCRLVLALHDLSNILREHDIVEVRIFSAFRPDARVRKGQFGRGHSGALAVDIREFRKASGAALLVLDHFNGRIGAPVCGEQAEPPDPSTPEALELRDIACKAAAGRRFNLVLTPNNDKEHDNHFHLEVTPDVAWFIVR